MSFFFFCLSAFLIMVAPGPNNLMIMHSACSFGLDKTKNHFLGIIVGVGGMLFLVSLGVGIFIAEVLWVRYLITILGSIYMIYLGLKIILYGSKKIASNSIKRPMTFLESLLFQLVNPKAWYVSIAFSGMFHYYSYFIYNAIALVLVKTLINIPCLYLWGISGKGIKYYLQDDRKIRILNFFIGSFLIFSVILLWI